MGIGRRCQSLEGTGGETEEGSRGGVIFGR